MNKTELIEDVAARTVGSASDHLTKGDVEKVVNATLASVTSALANGDGSEVVLPGFGKFSTHFKEAREAQTFGETKQIAAKNVVKFKPGASLKDAVN